MRHFLRKPNDMTTREFISHMVEINKYLKSFPDFQAKQELHNNKIMDIAEFGMPNSWQKQMVLQGFNPLAKSTNEFIEFCKRLGLTVFFLYLRPLLDDVHDRVEAQIPPHGDRSSLEQCNAFRDIPVI